MSVELSQQRVSLVMSPQAVETPVGGPAAGQNRKPTSSRRAYLTRVKVGRPSDAYDSLRLGFALADTMTFTYAYVTLTSRDNICTAGPYTRKTDDNDFSSGRMKNGVVYREQYALAGYSSVSFNPTLLVHNSPSPQNLI